MKTLGNNPTARALGRIAFGIAFGFAGSRLLVTRAEPGARGGHYGADAVGVDECDDYLATYERCVDKGPSDQRTTMRENIKCNRTAWRALAADPGARPGLAQSCKLARESARTVTKSYGCTGSSGRNARTSPSSSSDARSPST